MPPTHAATGAFGADPFRTPAISELLPGVEKVTIFVAFEEADVESDPNYQQIIFTADAEACFRLDCSRIACAGGGFDFAPMVADLVKRGESQVHGTLDCEGLFGTGGERCSLRAEYRILIEESRKEK